MISQVLQYRCWYQSQNTDTQKNKLMHNHNITAPQRVLYVSGMLLAMQKVAIKNVVDYLDIRIEKMGEIINGWSSIKALVIYQHFISAVIIGYSSDDES